MFKRFFLFIIMIFIFINLGFSQNLYNLEINKNVLNNKVDYHPFETSLYLDIPLMISGVTVFTLSLFMEKEFDYNPNKIRDLQDVNAFDRWSANKYSENVDKTSDFLMIAALAIPGSLLIADINEFFTWAIMYMEAFTLTFGIKDIIKNNVYRERPYMYFEKKSSKQIESGDFCNSFLSGHATFSFLGASFGSYVFAKSFSDSKFKIPIIIGSYSLATITSALRLISGCHFFSDVIAGATLGTLIGIGIPFLHELNYKINQKIDSKNIENLKFNLSLVSLSCVINF